MWPGKGWRWLRGVAVRQPLGTLGLAAAVAILGWVLVPQSEFVSGLSRLAPADLREVEDFDALGRESGVERNLSVVVTASDLTAPGVMPWMVDYQREVLARHGYTEEGPCKQAELCPAVPLASLFGSGRSRSRAQNRALLRSLPAYFTQSVISPDRRTGNIPFLIRSMPVSDQRDLMNDMRRRLDPPGGVRAELGGTTVLAVDAAEDLESSKRNLALLALLAVFGVMAAVFRHAGRAAASFVPVVMASGWSALIVVLAGFSVSPLSATLGALAVGLGGYVAISLAALYREERVKVSTPEAAVERAYERGGPTRAFAGVAVAGFAALVASDVRMLREFGAVAVLDLAVVVAGVTLVLPAALIWAERHPVTVPRSRAEWAAAGRGAYRRARAGVAATGRALRRLPGAVRAFPKHARRLPALVGKARRFRPLRRRDEAQGP